MNKKVLHNVLVGLVKDQAVSVHMRGTPESVDCTVVSVKNGRGRGGSKLCMLQKTDGTVFEVGTPKSMDILSITVNGEKHGIETEAQEPTLVATNEANAEELKMGLKHLLDLPNTGAGKGIRLQGRTPELSGDFAIMSTKKGKGRYGQIVLSLQRNGQNVDFMTYRHSGVVESFELFDLPVSGE